MVTQARGARMPWFRVHIVLLNDPGRLIATHIVHSSVVAGWAASMILYEVVLYDYSDPLFNPLWRQGCFVLPFTCRLGVVSSSFLWSLDFNRTTTGSSSDFTFEGVLLSHFLLAGLLLLASFWHWSFWAIDLYLDAFSGQLRIDFPVLFGLHLQIASLVCMCFGLFHLTSYFGPGFWTSDSYGLVGSLRGIKPVLYGVDLSSYGYGVLTTHHIAAGLFGLLLSLWKLSSSPPPSLFAFLCFDDSEGVLSNSLIAVGFVSGLTSFTVWFGSVIYPIELFGTTRYHWDNGYFFNDITRRISSRSSTLFSKLSDCINIIPDKLVLYDYIGSNPSKGGIFRSGPLNKGDGLLLSWCGSPSFELGSLYVSVRRMPSFFESFPVVFLDRSGTVRADIPFRRAESKYSLEQSHVRLSLRGGILEGSQYSSIPLVKSFARKSILGSLVCFDQTIFTSEGVFRCSLRTWYSFTHLSFTLLILFGHLWHAGRTLFRSVWNGLSTDSD